MEDELQIDKHIRYFQRCLAAFPAQALSEDANFLALVYFCLHGEALVTPEDKPMSEGDRHYYATVADHIYDKFVIETDDWQGFRPTAHFSGAGAYDLAYVSATFFALTCLLQLQWQDYSTKIKPKKIMKFIQLCLDPDGGVFPALSGRDHPQRHGEPDLRQVYMALGIVTMVKQPVPPAITDYVLARVSFNGGMALTVGAEPHLGFTFCGLAALKLAGYHFERHQWHQTIDWLVHRQVDYDSGKSHGYDWGDYEYYDCSQRGLFNGRENKLGDTCYLWWCMGLLAILGAKDYVDKQAAKAWLLTKMQHPLFGGFSKDGVAVPDPLHSYLALAALSRIDGANLGLPLIDEALVMHPRLLQFLKQVSF